MSLNLFSCRSMVIYPQRINNKLLCIEGILLCKHNASCQVIRPQVLVIKWWVTQWSHLGLWVLLHCQHPFSFPLLFPWRTEQNILAFYHSGTPMSVFHLSWLQFKNLGERASPWKVGDIPSQIDIWYVKVCWRF